MTPTRTGSTLFASLGLAEEEASKLAAAVEDVDATDAPQRWMALCRDVLRPDQPFEAHLRAHRALFANWDQSRGPTPVWLPDPEAIKQTNLASLMRERGLGDYAALHRWSVTDRFEFWEAMIRRLEIRFIEPYERIIADENEIEAPAWLSGATLNIAESCFRGDPDRLAIIHAAEDGELHGMSLGELDALANRVANGLRAMGLKPGDAVAVDTVMTAEAVAIYLGIVRAGCAVVSIADSFAPTEIATRLRIAKAKAIFTQDFVMRGGRLLPLYEKVRQANAPMAVVLPVEPGAEVPLRDTDMAWSSFLSDDTRFDPVPRRPTDVTNILFSSGTTGEPKAIPWTHTTPIKCAADGWLHHDIRPGDVIAWPTNLGWMMGPWLIYAALINRATIALYEGAPNLHGFCAFVQNAQVTMLGVVPSLVKTWRLGDALGGADWSSIRCFSSTGECSNAEDMFWLMSRAGYKPVIEYCGGTEIGGGYITGTMIQPAVPAAFSTPALGLDVLILDEQGHESETGELFLVPPSIGLSTALINRDHHEVYFEGTPRGPEGQTLRRHGDEICRLGHGYLQALGRADDTMNLGGIKTSSAEIERVLNQLDGVRETAAVAAPPSGGGPDRLFVFAVPEPGASLDPEEIRPAMQAAIRSELNPLFRIHAVRCVASLPRTASNKVLRRTLRGLCLDQP